MATPMVIMALISEIIR